MKIKTMIITNAEKQINAVNQLDKLLSQDFWLFSLDKNCPLDEFDLNELQFNYRPIVGHWEGKQETGLIVFGKEFSIDQLLYLRSLNAGQKQTITSIDGKIRLINNWSPYMIAKTYKSIYMALDNESIIGDKTSIMIDGIKIYFQFLQY